MALGGGMSCVKYLLFCFNLLFAVTGLIILIIGAKTEIESNPYIEVPDSNFYSSGPIVLIVVGLIIFIIAFFGCCGALKENHCMIVTFSVFLLIVFVAELAVGIAGYINHATLETSIEKYFNSTIERYNNNTDIKHTYDIIQSDFHCCGIRGPEDWAAHSMSIPDSCCAAREMHDGVVAACDATSQQLHKSGCFDLLVKHYKDIAIVLGGVGLGIAIVQLLGVIFACCLARSIRREYETV